MPSRLLLLFAHPAPRRSRYNSRLLAAASALDGVQVRDLYELYPHFHVDVAAEQAALRAADVIVWQFPLYWFSMPALLKEWTDGVLTRDFAFGAGDRALVGKRQMIAISTGGGLASYSETGPHGAPVETYLQPFAQTARFCGMVPLDPFIRQGVNDFTRAETDEAARQYQARLKELIESQP